MITDGRPLRILQVLEPSGGGSGRHFLDLCQGLKKRGHSVDAIFSPVRAEARFIEELRALNLQTVHAIGMTRAPGYSDISSYRGIRNVIRSHGPFDIVHGHSSKAGALTRLPLPGKAKTVYTPHAFRTMDPTLGLVGRMLFGGIESFFGRFLTDQIICVSEDERAHALRLLVPRRKLTTIVNGVNAPDVSRRLETRTSFGYSADDFVFGFVGRLSVQKAPERLISAFERMAPSFKNAKLLLIGHGELEHNIRARIAASTHRDRITLTSALPGPDAVQAMDALVMPSRYEAMSYVMLEAAAAGKPMVLTDVGGARTVLQNGVNGILVKNSDDIGELAIAMLSFADMDARGRMTDKAIDRKDLYDVQAMLDATEAVYRNLLT